ncbi:transcription termination/antitermination NusG family protein [Pseudomonas sp. MYb118]|uniref:transcription termination/antitermination NusG family protein n=1 Tax=Pseudomonas sp. MYb118 TaxID=1848720 RepID=UPI0034D01D1E
MNGEQGFERSVSAVGAQLPGARDWYLAQCKPRQDERAEEHLTRHGYIGVRPMCIQQSLVNGHLHESTNSFSPGCVFIQPGPDCSRVPLRSMLGVSRIVSFGERSAAVGEDLVWQLHARVEGFEGPLFLEGEPVRDASDECAEMDNWMVKCW